jgi:hypothetical protein
MSEDVVSKVVEEFNKLAREGLQQVKFMKEEKSFASSLSRATESAINSPGCEVKVTCRNTEECSLAWNCIIGVLEGLELLDANISSLEQIELTNGSCILIRYQGKRNE